MVGLLELHNVLLCKVLSTNTNQFDLKCPLPTMGEVVSHLMSRPHGVAKDIL
jgi:hypothetical protein